jgi:hypothetical protein
VKKAEEEEEDDVGDGKEEIGDDKGMVFVLETGDKNLKLI